MDCFQFLTIMHIAIINFLSICSNTYLESLYIKMNCPVWISMVNCCIISKETALFVEQSYQRKKLWLFVDFPPRLMISSVAWCLCVLSCQYPSVGTSSLIKNCIVSHIRISKLISYSQNSDTRSTKFTMWTFFFMSSDGLMLACSDSFMIIFKHLDVRQ